jgi:two-component system phosphate regulon sensor histidine kinase PhoR
MELLIIALLIPIVLFLAYVAYHQRVTLVEMRYTLRDKNQHLSQLTQDTTTLRQEKITLEKQVTRVDDLLIQVRGDLASQSSTLQELNQQNEHYQNEITALQEKISLSEHESLQSKALFTTLASVAYDVVIVLDEEGEIIALNRSADVLFGDVNPLGESLVDLIDTPDLEDLIERALSESESLETQLVIDKQYYRVRTQKMQYDDGHVFIGFALQDITQLVRLNRARRDMVANISHELRTPIANIRLHIDSLFHDQDRPKRKASIATLRDIARETDSLLWLVQELLDLSMIESGQAIMKLVPNNLLEIVHEGVERLRDQLDVKDIKIVQYVPARLFVLCDRDQTRRVLMNLIRNSIKWSPKGESITISASAHGEDVRISVFDNGPGVPDDQVERVFERFYQIDTARSKGEGSGLGLAICKHIVEAHGGKIWADGNSKGNGGRFTFALLDAGAQGDSDQAWLDAGQHDAGLNALIARNRGDDDVQRDEKGYPIDANRLPLDEDGYIEFEDDEYVQDEDMTNI